MRRRPAHLRTLRRGLISGALPLALLLSILSPVGAVTWLPVRALTTSGEAFAREGVLALSGSRGVGVAYAEITSGLYQAFFRRSGDGGDTWKSPVRLSTGSPSHAVGPSVSSSGSTIDAVWLEQDSNGEWRVRYARSTDRGATWAARKALSPGLQNPSFPHVARDGTGRVAVTWTEGDPTTFPYVAKVIVRVSIDGGASFGGRRILASNGFPDQGDPIGITGPPGLFDPVIAISNGRIHVAYRVDGTIIKYRRSSNNGSDWSTPKTITTSAEFFMDIAAAGSIVVVGYGHLHNIQDTTVTTAAYRRSADGGATWSTKRNLSSSTVGSSAPVVSQRGGIWRVSFMRLTTTAEGGATYYRESTDGGLTWSSVSRVSPKGQQWARPIGVGFSRGAPIVVWGAYPGNLYFRRGQ